MDKQDYKNYIKRYKKLIFIITIPLAASVIPIIFRNKQANCAFVLIVMSLYWTTECLPIAITSLLPIVLFPFFGIISSKNITRGYFQDIILLFYGGLVMANAIEISGLHERVSLRVLILFGSNPKWLMLGFMIVTAFMSLWISNAASCSMMLPMINAVVQQLILHDQIYIPKTSKTAHENKALEISMIELDDDENLKKQNIKSNEQINTNNNIFKTSEKARKLSTGFLLSCSYSSTIGGLGSLVGTAPNILLKGFFDENYPEINLGFLNFSLFALPVSIILIIVSWLWLVFKWLPREYFFTLFSRNKIRKENKTRDVYLKNLIKEKYESLGPTSFEQKCVAIIFVSLIFFWITRDIQGIIGWSYLFKLKYVSDSTPAILAVFVLFACPKKNIFKGENYEHLLNWKQLQNIFPWNVILLIGGGLAIAEGFQHSGLSKMIGENLKNLMSIQKEVSLLIIITLSAIATEFTSNTSISSILIPIVDSIAKELKISPVYLLLPLILSVSLAFMLPVATPNNALIFANGNIKMKDMITTGIAMNLFGLSTVYIAANSWLKLIFNLSFTENITFANNKTNTTIFS